MHDFLKNIFLLLISFLFFLFTFAFLFFSCEKQTTPVENKTPNLSLEVDEVAVTEVWLTLQTENLLDKDVLQVFRNDSIIYTSNPGPADTTLYDSGLLPAHSYSYHASLTRNNQVISETNSQSITTMDTTSHDFTWTIDTIGIYGSVLYDVAMVDENDIWAVGEIHTPETDRYDSLGNWVPPFNAVHWDGIHWILERIYFYLCPNGTTPTPYPVQGIFSFSKNNIWFTRGASFVHWDGNTFTHDCSMNSLIDGSISKIWGSDLGALYGIGYNGTVIKYLEPYWHKFFSGTDLNLRDISGSGDHVFITGHSEQEESITLEVINNRVKTFLYSTNFWGYPSQGDYGRMYSVFALDNTAYIVAKQGIIKYNWERKDTTLIPDEVALYNGRTIKKITGTAVNDLLLTDAWGGFIHFNGTSWYLDERILNQFGPATFFPHSGVKKDNLAVVVGYYAGSMNAIIVIGTQTK